MAYLGRKGAVAGLTSADIPDDSITASKIASGAITAADVAADMATQAELDLKAPLASPVLVTPNLGTPSAVTLTNATFPAGHVLEVTNRWHNSSASVSVSSGTAADIDANDLDITATAGNKIVCWIVGGYVTMTATAWSGTGIRVYDGGDSANHDYVGPQGYSTTERSGNTSTMCVHTVQGSGTVSLKIKKMVWDKEGGGTITWYNAENKYTQYVAMEVQA